ncbi:hypothetical protein C0992_005385 [Termitomyces sp. T32_za158]|nr:hypothetical protein C0992_005385 [Termitomyces sp. T32_za158]
MKRLEDKILSSTLKKLDVIQELVVAYVPLEQISYLTSPAPLLKRCYLGFYSTKDIDTDEHTLFAGYAPQLKHLSLLGCGMDWRPLITVNLESLEISEVFLEQEYFLSIKDILEALSHSPHLQSLIISCVFVPSEEPLDSLTVNLPKLKYIKILSSLRGCVQLLGHLNMSLNPRIKVSCHPTEITGSEAQLQDMRSLTSIVHQKTTTESPIRSLRIRKMDSQDDLTITARMTSKSREKERFVIKAPSFGEEESRARESILQILLPRGYSYLQSLDISSHNVTLSDAEWKRIGELDSLREIRINSIHARGFLKVFSMEDEGTQLAGHHDAVNDSSFKVLQILYYQPPRFEDDDIVSADAFRDMLDTSLKARKKLKLKVPTLRHLQGNRFIDMEVF